MYPVNGLAMAQRGVGGVQDGLEAFKGGIEDESLVGPVMGVLEVLNLLNFSHLLILFIL